MVRKESRKRAAELAIILYMYINIYIHIRIHTHPSFSFLVIFVLSGGMAWIMEIVLELINCVTVIPSLISLSLVPCHGDTKWMALMPIKWEIPV